MAVVTELTRIEDIHQLDPDKFGLYVRSDQGNSAIVLPQRTGISDVNDQVATAIREAGIDPTNETMTKYRVAIFFDEE